MLTMPNTREKEKLIELVEQGYNKYANPNCEGDLFAVIADHLIANGVTVQKWIPVTERLPEQYSSVIVWTSERELGEAQFDGKKFEWCADEAFADVTHWMPLPEPPKGE